MDDNLVMFQWLFRAFTAVTSVLCITQLIRLRHAVWVRRQLQLWMCIAEIGIAFRCIAPPYPLADGIYGLPLWTFFLADTMTSACIYTGVILFVRYIVVIAHAPETDRWWTHHSHRHDLRFAVVITIVWIVCIGVVYPVVYRPQSEAHYWIGGLTCVLAVISLLIAGEVWHIRMVIVRTIVDEPLPLYAKAFHQRFLALCHYVQISSTAVFLAEMAAAFAEMSLDSDVPLARPVPSGYQTGVNLWLLQSYPLWAQSFLVFTFHVFTWHRGSQMEQRGVAFDSLFQPQSNDSAISDAPLLPPSYTFPVRADSTIHHHLLPHNRLRSSSRGSTSGLPPSYSSPHHHRSSLSTSVTPATTTLLIDTPSSVSHRTHNHMNHMTHGLIAAYPSHNQGAHGAHHYHQAHRVSKPTGRYHPPSPLHRHVYHLAPDDNDPSGTVTSHISSDNDSRSSTVTRTPPHGHPSNQSSLAQPHGHAHGHGGSGGQQPTERSISLQSNGPQPLSQPPLPPLSQRSTSSNVSHNGVAQPLSQLPEKPLGVSGGSSSSGNNSNASSHMVAQPLTQPPRPESLSFG